MKPPREVKVIDEDGDSLKVFGDSVGKTLLVGIMKANGYDMSLVLLTPAQVRKVAKQLNRWVAMKEAEAVDE